MAAAAAAADVHAVLQTCGIGPVAIRNRIITSEGFNALDDIGIMESDSDVTDMAKRLASRPANAGRVHLGTIQIKNLQCLVWWIRDRQRHNQAINSADFDIAAMNAARESKRIEKERSNRDATVSGLAKFQPDEFDEHEDAFLNLLSQRIGSLRVPLRYVVRAQVTPTTFATENERRMYQIPLAGESYDDDNHRVYRLLKEYLINTPGWAWIEPFDATENGREAFWAWSNHYNGQGELSKRMQLAKAQLKALHYKNERALTFEKYTEKITRAFAILNKDRDERLSSRQQVEALLNCIRTSDSELQASKAVITQSYLDDLTGAYAHFSSQVSRLHGSVQLEARRYAKRKISETSRGGGRDGGRGRGRGRFSHGGRRGGHGGRGGRGDDHCTKINGIDVSDPNRSFTSEEWEALSFNGGRAYVMQARERMAGRGSGRGRADQGRGRGGRSIHMTQVQFQDDQEDQQRNTGTQASSLTQSTDTDERGGRNGTGFGRGAYQRT